MTEREARGDSKFDYLFDDLDDNDGWYGQAEFAHTAPTVDAGPTADVDDTQVEDDVTPLPAGDSLRRDHSPDNGRDFSRESTRGDIQTRADIQTRRDIRVAPPEIGTWTFKVSRPPPWYRSKGRLMSLIAVALAAIAVSTVLLALRGSASGSGQSTVSPAPSTSAGPSPTSAAPAPSAALPPPPAPLPPPPSPAPEASTPPRTTWSDTRPRQTTPDQTDNMPEVGVTRTPATRKPISVAPPPPPPPSGHNSATPGDGRRHRGFF